MKTDKIANIGAPVGLLLIFGATLVPFFFAGSLWAGEVYKYVYAAGALLMLAVRLFTPYRGANLKLKRWHRIEAWSAIFFCVAAAFLFIPHATLRDWLAFTLAGAVLQIITSLAIPRLEAKEQ